MIAVFLLLVIAAMVLGILRVVAKGLLLLLFIGIVVFLCASSWASCGCGGDQGSARPANSAPVTLDASV
jgi:hypothetical protein